MIWPVNPTALVANRMTRSPMGENPWQTREEDLWSIREHEKRSRFVINYAVLAPSSLNTQPWLFSVDQDRIEMFADRRRGLAVADPDDRQLTISCGAALHYLTLAMRRFGRKPVVHTFPDLSRPDLLAVIRWGGVEKPSPGVLREFEAIKYRRGEYAQLAPTEISEAAIAKIVNGFDGSGTRLNLLADRDDRRALAEIVHAAASEQAADGRFRREQASWTHPDRRRSRDGLPNAQSIRKSGVNGLPSLTDFVSDVVNSGPVVFMLASRNDSHASWLETGQAMARLLLLVAGVGLSGQFMNEPLEIPRLRERVEGM
ncbi:MAG: nitroreductase [Rhodothermales bacterium]|jgi:nitroreductase